MFLYTLQAIYAVAIETTDVIIAPNIGEGFPKTESTRFEELLVVAGITLYPF